MAKAHIERRDRSGKALCGATIPEGFNPWSTRLETCERCSRIDAAARERGAAKSAARMPSVPIVYERRPHDALLADEEAGILDALVLPVETVPRRSR